MAFVAEPAVTRRVSGQRRSQLLCHTTPFHTLFFFFFSFFPILLRFDGEVSGRRQPDRARSAHRSQFTLNGAAVAHGEPNPHAGAGPHHRLTHKLHHAESARTEFGGQRPVTAPGGPPPSAHYQGMTDAAGRPTHFHRAPRGERVLSPEVGNWGVPQQQERLTAGWKEEAVTSPTSHEQVRTHARTH